MASTVDASRVAEFQEDPEDMEAKVRQLADWVRQSSYTVFFTGAGVSTAAGIGDYRGPSGAWTRARIAEIEAKGAGASPEELAELAAFKEEQGKELVKCDAVRVPKEMVDPGFSHMAIATMVHRGFAHYCITTNLDGLFRKAGLKAHTELCCLHGDIFVERCTSCDAEFERNYRVRHQDRHVHDHHAGVCDRCESTVPEEWTGRPHKWVMKAVTLRALPPLETVSMEKATENARRTWPTAVLTSVNDVSLQGEDDNGLRRIAAECELPLRFGFRVASSLRAETGSGTSFQENSLVGVQDRDVGTKDTHINFGEALDQIDVDEADGHCRKADLCIVLGTSMSLNHCTGYPFLARRTAIVNLQQTPVDFRCDLRIWGACDTVLGLLLESLGVDEVETPPAWRPKDAVPLEDLVRRGLSARCQAIARHIDCVATRREAESVEAEA